MLFGMAMKDRINEVADLLMIAAYADGQLLGEEKSAVAKLLRQVLGASTLPMDVNFRIEEFAPATFDLEKTAAVFASDPPATKRALLQLIAAVHAADAEHDFDEDAHLRQVATAIGLPPSAYADMVIDILEIADLPASLAKVRQGT
jgi:uncharacterized tellurite resistance protein B-like protein